ncbi:hypothetical protein [Pelagibacterium halotolerans]|uniref:hypothetical protein n=1 Tax=Pelagibacterium halotolerans TaxID=531813 RepID=UPI00384C7D9E
MALSDFACVDGGSPSRPVASPGAKLRRSNGYREQVIAFKLGTSVHTVRKQIASARRRLKAATTVQAVAKATALGVLEN